MSDENTDRSQIKPSIVPSFLGPTGKVFEWSRKRWFKPEDVASLTESGRCMVRARLLLRVKPWADPPWGEPNSDIGLAEILRFYLFGMTQLPLLRVQQLDRDVRVGAGLAQARLLDFYELAEQLDEQNDQLFLHAVDRICDLSGNVDFAVKFEEIAFADDLQRFKRSADLESDFLNPLWPGGIPKWWPPHKSGWEDFHSDLRAFRGRSTVESILSTLAISPRKQLASPEEIAESLACVDRLISKLDQLYSSPVKPEQTRTQAEEFDLCREILSRMKDDPKAVIELRSRMDPAVLEMLTGKSSREESSVRQLPPVELETPVTVLNSIGANVKKFCDESSQRELEAKSGVSKTRISNLCNGKFAPSLDILVKLANAMRMRPRSLVSSDGEADSSFKPITYLSAVDYVRSKVKSLVPSHSDSEVAELLPNFPEHSPTTDTLTNLAFRLGASITDLLP